MKINKSIIAVAAVALCAYNAQAFKYQVAISSTTTPLGTGPDSSIYTPGQTGQTDFNFTLTGGTGTAATLPWAATTLSGTAYTSLTSVGSFSSVVVDGASDLPSGPGTMYTESANDGNGYDEIVDWTISPSATTGTASITFSFALVTPNGSGATNPNTKITATQTLDIDIVAPVSVPEPAQTVAGGMLLGCGGLVFAGRRLFKKQTA